MSSSPAGMPPRGRGAAQVRLLLGLIWLCLICCVPARARADALDSWRSEAAAVRLLAENDAPRAYREAKRLEAGLPANAPPADRARMLNLLSRIELYLALTRPAADHAEAALALAKRHNDKVGQIEANLNINLNAINQGRIATMADAAIAAFSLANDIDRPDLLGEAMLHTAMVYLRNGELDASVTLAMQAMDIAQLTKDPLVLAYAHQGLAISYQQTGRHAQALQHYTLMRDHARAAHSRILEAHALRGLGTTKIMLGDFEAAKTHSHNAIELFRAAGTPFYLGHALYGEGERLRATNRHQEALQVFDQVVDLFQRNPNKIALWWALQARSAEHLTLGHVAAGTADGEAAQVLAQDLSADFYLIESARRLAEAAAAAGDHRRAYALSVRAAELATKSTQEKAGQRIVELAQRYQSERKQHRIDELVRREQSRAFERRWLWTVLAGSLAVLAATGFFLVRLRRANRALAALNAEVEQSRSRLQQSEQTFRALVENLPDYIVRYDLECRRTYVSPRLAELFGRPAHELVGKRPDEDSPLASWEQYLGNVERVIATGQQIDQETAYHDAGGRLRWGQLCLIPEFGADGTVASILAIGRDVTALLETQHRLEESRRQLRELAARRETAREEERRRIAREVHDELGQQLTALRLKVNILNFRFGKDEPGLRDVIGELLTMVDRTIQVARNVSTSLRPAVLDMGIVTALEWLAAEFKRNTGISCELALPATDVCPDEEIAVVLFRTAQESLTNAARHAKAQRVRLALSVIDGQFVLEIEDDGTGFDPDAPRERPSFGLLGIRERAQAVGGEATVSSIRQEGTMVRIRIPAPAPEAEATAACTATADTVEFPLQPQPSPTARTSRFQPDRRSAT